MKFKMDGLLKCLVCVVVISHPLSVSGKRDLEAEFDALVTRFDEMEVSHQNEINKLRQENEYLRRIHQNLRQDNEELKRDHEHLRRNNEKLKRDQNEFIQKQKKQERNKGNDMLKLRKAFNDSLKSQKKQCQDFVTMIRSDSSDDNRNFGTVNHQQADRMVNKKIMNTGKIVNPVARNLGDHNERAAFYAFLSHDVTNIGTNQTMVFDKVVTNVGNLYSGVTGVFTCDLSGTYVFYVHLLAEPRYTVYIVLMQNNTPVSYIYASSSDSTFSHGGNTAILQLQRGDRITVREQNHQPSSGDAIDAVWTSFSGFLLYPENIEPSVVG